VLLLRVGSPAGSLLCPLTVSVHTLLALVRAARTSYPRGHGGPGMWRWGTQAISLYSVLIVNTARTPLQRPLRASLTSSVSILMVKGTGKTVQAILVAVFPVLISQVQCLLSRLADQRRER
jgi:hypothetical protein